MLRFSLQSADNLNISCTSLGNHHSRQSSVPTLSVSGAGKRHFVGAEVGRGWWWQKPESRRKAESLWTRCCRNKPELQTCLPTPCQGLLDWQAQCPQEQSLSTSSEARFIFNRVSQNDYRISHSLSHKATYTQFCFLFVFCCFSFSYPYHPTHLYKYTSWKSNTLGIVVSFTEDAKERKTPLSSIAASHKRTAEVCSHQGLEWAGNCWYRMSALHVEQTVRCRLGYPHKC